MTRPPRWIRIAVTALLVLAAVVAARAIWVRYELEPWTRDGRVRADVVAVAPDVAGFVTEVHVRDNQLVRRGDLLFVLDAARSAVALQQAGAAVDGARAALAEAEREAHRNDKLPDLISAETRDQSRARVEQGRATLEQAVANRAAAALNLQRARIYAPVNGAVTNLDLRPGGYFTIGRPALALVDADSVHVDGYFEETKLPRIRVGDRVSIRLMGEARVLHGHVDSIAGAIADRERATDGVLVANINPTFSWVRLAQRVPVRVALDGTPGPIRLIAGRTATVTVLTPHGSPRPWWDLRP
ncbi:HlyD family secretion protein [Phenylobacterium sp.]|jgi:RND family efflux transporter MFP subunit|uniref:HlyD family secretion protein n=1 Tax=Phenylobacterium sp. TaxID=1871053 RepID=UPI002F420FC2